MKESLRQRRNYSLQILNSVRVRRKLFERLSGTTRPSRLMALRWASRRRLARHSSRQRATAGPQAAKFAGGHRIRVTPVPIPNTEVKPDTADGTARETVWESRSLPALFWKARLGNQSGLLFVHRQQASVAALQARPITAQFPALRWSPLSRPRKLLSLYLSSHSAILRRRAFRLNFASHVREATSVTATQPTPHLPASQAANRLSSQPNQ